MKFRAALHNSKQTELVSGSRHSCYIGRTARDIVVNDEKCADVHAEIFSTGNQLWIRALNETRKILVNGKSVSSQILRQGDRVILGSTTIVIASTI